MHSNYIYIIYICIVIIHRLSLHCLCNSNIICMSLLWSPLTTECSRNLGTLQNLLRTPEATSEATPDRKALGWKPQLCLHFTGRVERTEFVYDHWLNCRKWLCTFVEKPPELRELHGHSPDSQKYKATIVIDSSLQSDIVPAKNPMQHVSANIRCFWYSTPLCESCPVEINPLVPLGLDISDPARKAHKDVYNFSTWDIGKKANKICRMLEHAKSFTRILTVPNILIARTTPSIWLCFEPCMDTWQIRLGLGKGIIKGDLFVATAVFWASMMRLIAAGDTKAVVWAYACCVEIILRTHGSCRLL